MQIKRNTFPGLLKLFSPLYIAMFLFLSCNITFSQSYREFELAGIDFEGNNSFSDSELKTILASKETPWWFWKFLNSFTSFGEEPEYFDTSKISIDKQAIKSFYNANGFFLADVEHSFEVDSSSKVIDLFYNIDEGNPSSYGKFNLNGFENMPGFLFDDMKSKTITIDSSNRYSQQEVQTNIDLMVKYLADNGYLFGDYDSTIVYMDTLKLRTDIDVYFTANNRYSISDVLIEKEGIGASDISYHLIEEISGIKTGQIYSQEQIDRSQFRLFRTGLFTSLEIDPVNSEAKDNLVPVFINAKIGTMNEISPEIKADNQNNSFNTGLGIDFIRKNFLGDARKLTLSLSTRIIDLPDFNFRNIFKPAEERDESYQGDFEILLRLEQPFLFGRPILSTSEGYYRGLTILNQSGMEYGVSQKFDFEMPPYTFITLMRPSLNLDFSNYTFDQTDDEITINSKSATPSIGVELGSTKTDNLFFPSEGYSLYLNPEFALSRTTVQTTGELVQQLEGTAYFYRLQTSMAYYVGLASDKSSVLALKLKSGYIQTISGGYELIPPTKTFFAGGSNSVRGWRARELVPEENIEYFGFTTENQLRGGTFLLEGTVELRQKIAGSMGIALFADYGNTWNSYKNISIDEIAVAAGFGFRYYSPIAPFRLDFGIKFYDPADKKTIFDKKFFKNFEIHFGIGEAF